MHCVVAAMAFRQQISTVLAADARTEAMTHPVAGVVPGLALIALFATAPVTVTVSQRVVAAANVAGS